VTKEITAAAFFTFCCLAVAKIVSRCLEKRAELCQNKTLEVKFLSCSLHYLHYDVGQSSVMG